MAARSEAVVHAPRPRPRRERERPTAAPPTARRRPARRSITGGVVLIGVVAVLLAGVVALNVAVLRLNVRLDGLGAERAKLRSDNAQLASRLSSANSSPRIQQLAHKRLGLVPADPSATRYIDLSK